MNLNKIIPTAILLVAPTAIAETNNKGWYAGLDLGSTSYNGPQITDDSDISVSLFGGYKFNKYFAVQSNAGNLGEYTGDVIDSTELSALTVTAVGILPISDNGFALYGRLGLGLLSYEQKYEILGIDFDNSSVGDAIVSAVGLSYTPNGFQQMSFHLAYQNYYFQTEQVYVDGDNESNSLSIFSFGARYNF